MESFFIVLVIGSLVASMCITSCLMAINYRSKYLAESEINEDLERRLKEDRLEIVKLRTSLSKLGRVVKVTQPLTKSKKRKDMWLAFQDSDATKYISVNKDKEEMTLFIVTPPTKEASDRFNKEIKQ